MSIFRTKSIEQSLHDTDEPEYQLKKSLTWLDLTVFGIGVVIGAGIFTLTGKAAATMAGPSIVLSFFVSAFACALAGMCYAEFASTVPVSGSAYTFSYASLGEFFAWVIGWDLILEMFLGASVVAQGWSAYLTDFLSHFNITLPAAVSYGSHFDLPAFVLILALGMLIFIGIKESMRVNMVLVGIKLFIVLFVIFAGLQFVKASNYHPFIPPSQSLDSAKGLAQPLLQWALGFHPAAFGVSGIFTGAALVFFAYIGFDVVATAAEETKNPQRDLPIGIILSLTVCTVLYAAVAAVITGMVRYDKIQPTGGALANAFTQVGKGWMATIISAGAVAGLTTVVLTLMIGATRLIFAMARDHLLPMGLAKVHPRFRTPYIITAIVTVVCAITAAVTPIGKLEEMVNIGTLSAFVLVSIGVIVLRRKRPDLPRAFKVPFVPVLPIISALACLYLTLNLSIETWLRFLIWLVIGLVIYFTYSMRHSRLGTGETLTHEFEEVLAHNN